MEDEKEEKDKGEEKGRRKPEKGRCRRETRERWGRRKTGMLERVSVRD